MKKVLVYGYYNRENIGDNLFIEAYNNLFPSFDFVFTDAISLDNLKDVDAVFFGGGSFLYGAPLIDKSAFDLLKSKKVFYLGVGIESVINPTHLELMSMAKMIATRSLDQLDRIKLINKNSIYLPDLVYSLKPAVGVRKNKSILVLPNIAVVPQGCSAHWKHASWEYFKSEFIQFLDELMYNGYIINLLPMCNSPEENDFWAGCELVSRLKNRNSNLLLPFEEYSIQEITNLISSYSLVITQRFHGIVLSEMTKTPYICIHHHDKLKFSYPANGNFISYHNISKDLLINSIKMKNDIKSIDSAIFSTFIREVENLI